MSQHDNHMDDLFKRAAANYALKPPGDEGWGQVAPRLQKPELPAAGAFGAVRKRAMKGILALALLIGLSAVVWHMNHDEAGNSKPDAQIATRTEGQMGDALANNNNNNNNNADAHAAAANGVPNAKEFIAPASERMKEESNTGLQMPAVADGGIWHTKQGKTEELNAAPTVIAASTAGPAAATDEEAPQRPLHYTMMEPGVNPQPATLGNPLPAASLHMPTVDARPAKFFYGASIGMGFSSIKGQQLSKPGIQLSVLAGYRFNRTWSVESGIRYSRKSYYTAGEHFSMKVKDTSMPADMSIVLVNGSSNVLEIPLRVNHEFKPQRRGQYFVSGSLISYVLTKESNAYLLERNGVTSSMDVAYTKASGYVAAALELSGGFTYKMKHKQSLRMEPFVQVPLQGVGVGQLPISGFGLRTSYIIGH